MQVGTSDVILIFFKVFKRPVFIKLRFPLSGLPSQDVAPKAQQAIAGFPIQI